LNEIASISSICSFSSITSGIVITSSPLEVNIISNSSVEILWNKIVFCSRIGLNDISSLSSDVEVKYSYVASYSSGSLNDTESERSILESSSKLSCINSKLKIRVDWISISISLISHSICNNWISVMVELSPLLL